MPAATLKDSESGNGRPRSLLSRCLAEMPKFARLECQAWRCRHGLERSTRSAPEAALSIVALPKGRIHEMYALRLSRPLLPNTER